MENILLEECCDILDSRRIPITASKRKKGPYPYYGANGVQDYVADYIFDDELVLLAEDGGNFGSKDRPIAYRVSGKCWVNNHAHVLKPKSGLDVDYLCYSLMFYDTNGLVNGATRQKLTQAMMRKMLIPKRHINEQQTIVRNLNKICQVKWLREQELERLDTLIKARFVELFGDPSLNTKGYPVKSLPEIAEFWNGLTYKPEDVANKGTIVLRSSNIQNAQLDFADTVRVICKIGEKKYVQDNDILMCSRNGSARLVGKVALIKNIEEPMSFGAFMMIIRSHYYPYLMTYFQLPAFRAQIKTGATTTINQITGRMLNNVKVPVPKEPELESFISFMEQVDKSKVAVQAALDKTQLLFDSLMQQYFG
ncbi:restriction endonuclease subunit S [Absicoccus intestinalis]|uniref:Restriction endonuclease subunit S n=1 Tax=Absicoccus intestinalis TaxID=2926319 RepID=A0ABU4WLX4_9FIRM|nr:restriction endonuclease subunit S [Absicoccus sp. CLA-KB-P134]MDX8417562.1 restriction endonuclease subunit S [Absicoccus sp. CLA-KB-P134]